jgi:hypothetical protein
MSSALLIESAITEKCFASITLAMKIFPTRVAIMERNSS